jgi:exosortase A-associated hydrolase 2
MTATPTAFFIETGHGRIYAVHHAPTGEAAWGHILCVPAFNEEMNRCRSTLTLQAQELARHGVGTLVIDLFGTGESDGQYLDARWELWIEDLLAGIDWLDTQPGGCLGLLSIRLGVPLASEAIRQRPDKKLALLAWQAILDGKNYFTQFLRIRMAANMDRTDLPKETTTDMRNQLAAGQSVEIAGYEVHPDLAAAIERQRLAESIPPEGTPIAWFEKISANADALPAASQAVLQAWQHDSRPITAVGLDIAAYWSLHDRVIAPELIARTTEWVRGLRGMS